LISEEVKTEIKAREISAGKACEMDDDRGGGRGGRGEMWAKII